MLNLRNQARNGILWTTIRTVITSLLGPLLLIVKARHLTPEEFGSLAIINIFLSVINVIENFGFSTAIIQKDVITRDERSSLFFLQILICSILGIGLIFSAPIFVNVFNIKSLQSLLPLLSIIIFLNGPIILFNAFLEKEFYFKELAFIQITKEVTLFLFTSILLVLGYGLIGVVLGQIIGVIIMATLILLVSFNKDLFHLNFHFKLNDVIPYIKFGTYVIGKQLMTQLTHHVDELVVGYFMSAETLGLYYFAKNLLNRLRNLLTTSFSKVLLPLLSKLKNDRLRLKKAYNKISKYVGIFSIPIFFGIALTANIFVPAIFGEEWIESINFFIILSLAYIPYILTANIGTSVLYSLNKPDILLYTDLVVNITYIFLLIILSWLTPNIYLIVSLYALYLIGKTVIIQFFIHKYLHSSTSEYVLMFKYSLVSTATMSVFIIMFQKLLLDFDNLLFKLIFFIISGVIIYLTSYTILDKKSLIEMRDLILNR